MSKLETLTLDKITNTCLNLYTKLPKTGKPVENEWTVLSCVVKYVKNCDDIEVVSLGTGTKCIGASKLSPQGDVLNDSHAEVMARRGFLLYIYDQIDKALDLKDSIFVMESNRFKLRDGIEFMFYSSQLPCGDASIVPKDGEEDHFGDVLSSHKRKAESNICCLQSKILKADSGIATLADDATISEDFEPRAAKQCNDIHRTGAKCLPGTEQDSKMPGVKYHIYGQVRTKPGRGDRTLSVSCSDKMSRWVHMGIQGGLLDILLQEPIFISSFIFGSGVPFSKEALKRAFLSRGADTLDDIRGRVLPEFYQSSVKFPFVRKEGNTRPAAGSIVWIKASNQLHEVAVQGKKLGITKKKLNSPSSAICISKMNLYRTYQKTLTKAKDLKEELFQDYPPENVTYNEMKRMSKRYLDKWLLVKENFFKTWTIKPDIWNFCVKT